MPVDHKRYPANWKQISERIRFERAQNKCEWCQAPNKTWIIRRAGSAEWMLYMDWLCKYDVGERMQPYWKKTLVVLTVAHLGTAHADGTAGNKHDKMDVRDENLAALCQRCHLLYDIEEHKSNAAATRRNKQIAAGQVALWD